MEFEHGGGYARVGFAGRAWSFAKQRLRVELAEAARWLLPELDWKPVETTQTGVVLEDAFEPGVWAGGGPLPAVKKSQRILASFRPARVVLTEHVAAVFGGKAGDVVTKSFDVPGSSDLVLTSAFTGCHNCFPNAPGEDQGISGEALAPNSLQHICWPVFRGGTDASFALAVEPSVLARVEVPHGYTWEDLKEVRVKARLSLFGPLVPERAR